MTPHWISSYLGLPFKPGGRGPDFYDCWGVLRLVYTREFGIDLPEFPYLTPNNFQEQIAAEDWLPAPVPFDGAAVRMGTTPEHMDHVGIFVSGNVLHSFNGRASVAEPLPRLRFRGYTNVQFYRHRLWRG
jgi:cell wall-associated NlpC family hydrolase